MKVMSRNTLKNMANGHIYEDKDGIKKDDEKK